MQDSALVHIVFTLSFILIVISSLGVVLIKNPVRSTLLLIISFLPTSMIYVLLQAPLVGVLQILVYAGAIMMLFTFVIMMINPMPTGGEIPAFDPNNPSENIPKPTLNFSIFAFAILVFIGTGLIPLVRHVAYQIETVPVTKPDFGSIASIADLLFRDPMNNPLTVSFELISFLILVGIIAALNFSRRKGMRAP